MKKQIEKIILSEMAIYYGDVNMPKDWHIDKETLVKDITISNYYDDVSYPFSKVWDTLKTYISDYMRLEYKIDLIIKKTYGIYFEKNEISKPKLEIDMSNLDKSADFVCIYGVEIDKGTCNVEISYDDNRRKGLSWKIPVETNGFVMFPASQQYHITNLKNSYLNFIQVMTFNFPTPQNGIYKIIK